MIRLPFSPPGEGQTDSALMQTTHSLLPLAHHTLYRIDFDPATFSAGDLLWLPHYAQLMQAGRKRQAEHLAGRLAAVHALARYQHKSVPAIGEQRQPVWPAGLYGSISHCATTALAVVARQPVGVDMEALFTLQQCQELIDSIVVPAEQAILRAAALPLPLALTLTFSAKESAFKAWSALAHPYPGFYSARVIALTSRDLTLRFSADFSSRLAETDILLHWADLGGHVITVTA